MIKKVISVLLLSMILTSFAACGQKGSTAGKGSYRPCGGDGTAVRVYDFYHLQGYCETVQLKVNSEFIIHNSELYMDDNAVKNSDG